MFNVGNCVWCSLCRISSLGVYQCVPEMVSVVVSLCSSGKCNERFSLGFCYTNSYFKYLRRYDCTMYMFFGSLRSLRTVISSFQNKSYFSLRISFSVCLWVTIHPVMDVKYWNISIIHLWKVLRERNVRRYNICRDDNWIQDTQKLLYLFYWWHKNRYWLYEYLEIGSLKILESMQKKKKQSFFLCGLVMRRTFTLILRSF